jgi:branched-subunit amino acid ABC-type transport system permease component
MRAAAEDADSARLCGVSPEQLRLLAWVLAGMLAAAAGLLAAPSRPLTLELGVILGLKGTAAAVLGRLGSARGALVAGLGIGVGESLVTTLSLPALNLGPLSLPRLGPAPGVQDAGVLAVLVVAIAFAPRLLALAREPID